MFVAVGRYTGRQRSVYGILILLGIVAVFFSGCRTAPQYVVKDYPSLIYRTGNLFVSFTLKNDRKLVDAYLEERKSGNDYQDILKRTDRLSFAFTGKGQGRYFAVAEGAYSGFITSIILGNDSRWIKHKGLYTWWENKNTGLELSVPMRHLALFSTESITPLLERLKTGDRGYLPDSVKEEMKENALTLYTVDPSPELFRIMGVKADSGDVREVNIFLRRAGEESGEESVSYKLWGYVSFQDKSTARHFYTGLKVAMLAMAIRDGNKTMKRLIQEKPFVLQGAQILFNGVPLSLAEIMRLSEKK